MDGAEIGADYSGVGVCVCEVDGPDTFIIIWSAMSERVSWNRYGMCHTCSGANVENVLNILWDRGVKEISTEMQIANVV